MAFSWLSFLSSWIRNAPSPLLLIAFGVLMSADRCCPSCQRWVANGGDFCRICGAANQLVRLCRVPAFDEDLHDWVGNRLASLVGEVSLSLGASAFTSPAGLGRGERTNPRDFVEPPTNLSGRFSPGDKVRANSPVGPEEKSAESTDRDRRRRSRKEPLRESSPPAQSARSPAPTRKSTRADSPEGGRDRHRERSRRRRSRRSTCESSPQRSPEPSAHQLRRRNPSPGRVSSKVQTGVTLTEASPSPVRDQGKREPKELERRDSRRSPSLRPSPVIGGESVHPREGLRKHPEFDPAEKRVRSPPNPPQESGEPSSGLARRPPKPPNPPVSSKGKGKAEAKGKNSPKGKGVQFPPSSFSPNPSGEVAKRKKKNRGKNRAIWWASRKGKGKGQAKSEEATEGKAEVVESGSGSDDSPEGPTTPAPETALESRAEAALESRARSWADATEEVE